MSGLMERSESELIPGLTRASLEAVAAERLLCRGMLEAVNDLVELLERSPVADATFSEALDRSLGSWPRRRGRCDAAVGDLDGGWPRSVLREEFERILSLWARLTSVAEHHRRGAPAPELRQAMDAYSQELVEWSAWLDRSLGFWAGRWLPASEREDESCLDTAEISLSSTAGLLWAESPKPLPERTPERLDNIENLLREVDDALRSCSTPLPLDSVRARLLAGQLKSLRQAMEAIRSDDDQELRKAMDDQQDLAARWGRCRTEFQRGSLSEACQP